VSINPSSLPDGVTMGSEGNATIVIVDNDRKYSSLFHLHSYVHVNFPAIMVNFSQSNYNANENDELVQLMLVLSNPSSSDITVYVDTIDREATGERLRGPCIA